jgi:hypothetical protein
MTKNGFEPPYVLLHGTFLCENEDDAWMSCYLIFASGVKIPITLKKYLWSGKSEIWAKYRGRIRPNYTQVHLSGNHIQAISESNDVERLYTDHKLDNIDKKVGLVCLDFNEVTNVSN